MSDTKRDAAADLAVCAAATPGPWVVVTGQDEYDGSNYWWVGMGPPTVAYEGGQPWYAEDSSVLSQANATFLVTAYDALPHWIERATAAEAEVERLRALLLDGQSPDTCPVCFGNGEVLSLKPDGTLTGHGGCKACYGTGSKQEGGTS